MAKKPCPICKQTGKHIEGCPNHKDYFRDCLMDAAWKRANHEA